MPIPLTVLDDRREARDERGPTTPPTEDVREKVFELEARGEWIVQRVPEPWVGGDDQVRPDQEDPGRADAGTTSRAASAATSPATRPRSSGSSASSASTTTTRSDQTSCTAWNYYASATSNAGRPGRRGDAQLRGGLRDRLLPA